MCLFFYGLYREQIMFRPDSKKYQKDKSEIDLKIILPEVAFIQHRNTAFDISAGIVLWNL